MASIPSTNEEFRLQLVELYNKSVKLLDGTLAPIERLIEQGDVVVGVWANPNEPCGIEFISPKGNRLLLEIMAGEQRGRNIRITVVPCLSYEVARDVKEELGERDLDA